MIISNKKYQIMYDRIKALERQNRDLKHLNDSLKEENYQLIMAATGVKLDFPNSSKEPKSSGDKIY